MALKGDGYVTQEELDPKQMATQKQSVQQSEQDEILIIEIVPLSRVTKPKPYQQPRCQAQGYRVDETSRADPITIRPCAWKGNIPLNNQK